jgi:predicted NAD/FAD-binding protein
MRIAIIGSGISGLAVAWMLDGTGHEVVLFERNGYAGWHAHTLTVHRNGVAVHVDTAFSNLTSAIHPKLKALLRYLKVSVERLPGTFSLRSKLLREKRASLLTVLVFFWLEMWATLRILPIQLLHLLMRAGHRPELRSALSARVAAILAAPSSDWREPTGAAGGAGLSMIAGGSRGACQ